MKKMLYLIFLIIAVLNSCVTSSSRNRGSLSDAMEKARDDYPDKREVPSEPNRNFPSDSYRNDPYYNDPFYKNPRYSEPNYNDPFPVMPAENSDYKPVQKDMFTILRVGSTILSGPFAKSSFNTELLVGDDYSNDSLFLYGKLQIIELESNHQISKSLHPNPIILSGGVEYRIYPLKEQQIFSPYLLGRAGGIFLFWDYKNKLYDEDQISIESDVLGGITLSLGVGLDIFKTDKFRIGLTLIPSGYLYGNQTIQGFYNDYFTPSGDLLLSGEIGIKF